MTFKEAKFLLDEGKGIRLPEWTGYWFKDGQEIKAFTRTGDIIDASLDKFIHRDDWEEVTTGLGFDWALLAHKSGKSVRRSSWRESLIWTNSITAQECFEGHDDEEGYFNIEFGPDDILATDWVLAD